MLIQVVKEDNNGSYNLDLFQYKNSMSFNSHMDLTDAREWVFHVHNRKYLLVPNTLLYSDRVWYSHLIMPWIRERAWAWTISSWNHGAPYSKHLHHDFQRACQLEEEDPIPRIMSQLRYMEHIMMEIWEEIMGPKCRKEIQNQHQNTFFD